MSETSDSNAANYLITNPGTTPALLPSSPRACHFSAPSPPHPAALSISLPCSLFSSSSGFIFYLNPHRCLLLVPQSLPSSLSPPSLGVGGFLPPGLTMPLPSSSSHHSQHPEDKVPAPPPGARAPSRSSAGPLALHRPSVPPRCSYFPDRPGCCLPRASARAVPSVWVPFQLPPPPSASHPSFVLPNSDPTDCNRV